jgi:hypothetical protein
MINFDVDGNVVKSDVDRLLEESSVEELVNNTKRLLVDRARRLKYNREYMKQYRVKNPEYKKKCVEYALKSQQSKKVSKVY